MKCRAVIFDVGDVFYDATPWRRWLTGRLQAEGITIDYPSLCTRWEDQLVPVYRGQRPYWHAFRDLLAELRLPEAAAGCIEAAARDKAAAVAEAPLFEGVPETLAALHVRGIRLAVLSDTESLEQAVRDRLKRWEIGRYFHAVVTSAATGYVKPEPQAYAEAMSRLAVAPAESVFVGHDPGELRGAMAAGLTAIAFNNDTPVPARYHIRRFQDLLDLLD